MFGFLKKKLKEGIEKITGKVEEKQEEIAIQKVEEVISQAPEEPEEEEIFSIQPEKEEKPKKGLLAKLKKKITEKIIKEEDIKDVIWDLQVALIESDVAVEVAEKICNDLKKNLVGKSIKKKEIENVVKDSLKDSILEIMKIDSLDLIEKIKEKKEKPFSVVFLGFNGSGKSTTIAKIGNLLKQNNISCVFAAADSWRAAAIEQLEEHGENLKIKVIKQKYGADPAAIVWDSIAYAKAHNIDVVLADTAGRSHANVNLMDELKKICRVNKTDLKILVVDALTGNDVVDQTKLFDSAVGTDALILTKADVYDKGGAILSAMHTIKKPILFLGTGQNYKDIEQFEPEKIVQSLLA